MRVSSRCCTSAATWEKLEREKRLEGFDHAFLWLQAGHVLLGQLWSSSDRKGRSKYPMVLCVDGEGVAPGYVLTKVQPELERLRDACQKVVTADQVTAECRTAQDRLRSLLNDRASKALEMTPTLEARRRFLDQRELGPERIGLLRALHELGTALGSLTGARGLKPGAAGSLRSCHLRLPLASESPGQALPMWAAFLRCALPETVPLLLMARHGVNWLDAVIGETVSEDFFCLQASPKALPLATEIPYDIASELKERLRELEAKFLGAQPSTSATVGVSTARPAPAAPPPAAASGTPKAVPRKTSSSLKLWFALGGAVVLITGVAVWLSSGGRGSLETEAPVGSATSEATKPQPVSRAAQDYRTAMVAAQRAWRETNLDEAIKQGQLALKAKPGDAGAAKLVKDAGLKKGERDYRSLIDAARDAFARKDYSDAIAKAEAVLRSRATDTVATRLRADAQTQLELANNAKAQEQKYQTAMKKGQAAFDRKEYDDAIQEGQAALQARPNDGEATTLVRQARQGKNEIAAAAPAPANQVSASKGEKRTFTNGIGMEFVWIPGEEDWLGAAGLSAEQLKQPTDGWKLLTDNGAFKNEVIDPTLKGPLRGGSRGSQANGLCDLFGNVREWVMGEESAGFSYNSAGGRTKHLFLAGPFSAKDVWIEQATGFRCLLRESE